MPELKLGLTPKQIEARRHSIGGSDAGAIVAGGEEWQKLWAVKTGRTQPEDLSDILAVQMGSYTEPLNAFWYSKRTGRAVTRRNERVVHPDYDFLAANLDGVTQTSGAQVAYIDFKHVGKAGDQLTLRYTAQGTHCCAILGLDWWCLSCFIGNSKWELTEQEIEDPFFREEYIGRCRTFWDYVRRDAQPPGADPLPVPPPRQLRKVILDDNIDLWPNWGPAMAEEIDAFVRTEAAARANAIARATIKTLLPEDVGTVIRGRATVARSRNDAIRITTVGVPDE